MEEVYHLLRIIRELSAHTPGRYGNIMKAATFRLDEINQELAEAPAEAEPIPAVEDEGSAAEGEVDGE